MIDKPVFYRRSLRFQLVPLPVCLLEGYEWRAKFLRRDKKRHHRDFFKGAAADDPCHVWLVWSILLSIELVSQLVITELGNASFSLVEWLPDGLFVVLLLLSKKNNGTVDKSNHATRWCWFWLVRALVSGCVRDDIDERRNRRLGLGINSCQDG